MFEEEPYLGMTRKIRNQQKKFGGFLECLFWQL